MVGDSVNLASRIESLTKGMGADILISQFAREELDRPEEFLMRSIGSVMVAGKSEPVEIWEVFDTDPEQTAQKKAGYRAVFAEALDHYRRAQFMEAMARFLKCWEACPQDRVVVRYVERCGYLMRHPPEPNWQGVTVMPK